MNTTISVDAQGKDGKYDVWIATEGGSGAHYHDIDATKIGEYTADLVDTLEEAESGKSHLKSDHLQLPLKKADISELVGQMIDIFEDFLEDKGTEPFPNKERKNRCCFVWLRLRCACIFHQGYIEKLGYHP